MAITALVAGATLLVASMDPIPLPISPTTRLYAQGLTDRLSTANVGTSFLSLSCLPSGDSLHCDAVTTWILVKAGACKVHVEATSDEKFVRLGPTTWRQTQTYQGQILVEDMGLRLNQAGQPEIASVSFVRMDPQHPEQSAKSQEWVPGGAPSELHCATIEWAASF
jgi:hypothetical protein